MKLYQAMAQLLVAIENCKISDNQEWRLRHQNRLNKLVASHMPSGSGFDSGTKLSDSSTPESMVFTTSFHHMNEDGYYTHWTDHTITVTASLPFCFSVVVTGQDDSDVNDYIHEEFEHALSFEIVEEY